MLLFALHDFNYLNRLENVVNQVLENKNMVKVPRTKRIWHTMESSTCPY